MSVRRRMIMLRLILSEKHMSLYKLEKESHISHATLSDLYNEKYSINNCHIQLFYQLSKVLDMSIEELYESLSYKNMKYISFNKNFDVFKSSVCQELKSLKDKNFLIKYLSSDIIKQYFLSKDYLKAIYLVSIIDYLCKRNDLPLVNQFNDIRKLKLDKLYVPESLFLLLKSNQITISQVVKESNDIFLKHNIVESEIDNVY